MVKYDTREKCEWLINNGKIYELEDITEELKNDKDLFLKAVKTSGYCLKFASSKLKDDKELVEIAIAENPTNIQYASDNLKNDIMLIKKCVKNFGNSIQFASEGLRNNFEVAKIAIASNPESLAYVSANLKNNKELVEFAIERWPLAIRYMSDELKGDKEFIIDIASKYKIEGLQFVSERLRDDKEIVCKFVSNCGSDLLYASDNLKNNLDVVLLAAQNDVRAISVANRTLQSQINDWDNKILNFKMGYKKLQDLDDEMFQYEYFLDKIKRIVSEKLAGKYKDQGLDSDILTELNSKIESVANKILNKIESSKHNNILNEV